MAKVNDIILEAKANKFRRERLGISNADPLDLYKVLRQLNVLTNFRKMEQDFSGMALKVDTFRFMLVNSNHIRSRQNFTIGHELYHLFEDADFQSVCNAGRFDKKNKEEYNADIFSSYLLMPEEGILSVIPESELASKAKISLPTVVKLEQHFGVSRRALLTRLHKMGLMSYDECETFSTGIKRSAHELGYSTRLYDTGSDYTVIGDYGTICKKLYDEVKISESHYFSLMHDIGVNIDEKIDENGDQW
jgi:Zn-dependent peptidase ImmA (M78 family)